MQTSGKRACSLLSECSLPYAKVMQTSGKRACSLLPECSLPYAKVMQTSGKRACSLLSECSLPYAKVMQTDIKPKHFARFPPDRQLHKGKIKSACLALSPRLRYLCNRQAAPGQTQSGRLRPVNAPFGHRKHTVCDAQMPRLRPGNPPFPTRRARPVAAEASTYKPSRRQW